MLLDESAVTSAFENIPNYDVEIGHLYAAIATFLSHLPKHESPYEQAIAYRKLVGME